MAASILPPAYSRAPPSAASIELCCIRPSYPGGVPDPYTAVGLIPTVRGVRKRAEIQRNLDHIAHLVAAASWLSSLDLPVRLVLLPEGALQGFTDEVFDLDHFVGEALQ